MGEKGSKQPDFFADWNRIRQNSLYIFCLDGIIMNEIIEERLSYKGKMPADRTLQSRIDFIRNSKSDKNLEQLLEMADRSYEEEVKKGEHPPMSEDAKDRIGQILKERGIESFRFEPDPRKKNKPN